MAFVPVRAHVFGTAGGAVLFVVQRAVEGWLAVDLAGKTTDAIDARFEVTAGGPFHVDRIFAVHTDLAEVAAGRALAVSTAWGARRETRFAFGGDLVELIARARDDAALRLRLFRGVSVLAADDPRLARAACTVHPHCARRCRSRRAHPARERLVRGVPASRELVFDTPAPLAGLALERALVATGRSPRGLLVR